VKVWKTRTGRAGNPNTGSQRSGVATKSTAISTRFGDAQPAIAVSKGADLKAISASTSADLKAMSTVTKPKNNTQVVPQQHYIDAPSRIIWDGLVEMLVHVVTYTATSDMIFDDIVEILVPVLQTREDIKRALETRNADAVWLASYRLDMKSDATSQRLLSQPKMRNDEKSWRWAALR
jgi:hypothetical protein